MVLLRYGEHWRGVTWGRTDDDADEGYDKFGSDPYDEASGCLVSRRVLSDGSCPSCYWADSYIRYRPSLLMCGGKRGELYLDRTRHCRRKQLPGVSPIRAVNSSRFESEQP